MSLDMNTEVRGPEAEKIRSMFNEIAWPLKSKADSPSNRYCERSAYVDCGGLTCNSGLGLRGDLHVDRCCGCGCGGGANSTERWFHLCFGVKLYEYRNWRLAKIRGGKTSICEK